MRNVPSAWDGYGIGSIAHVELAMAALVVALLGSAALAVYATARFREPGGWLGVCLGQTVRCARVV
jgi:hypothetical protein